jgi:hypothetical protein
MVNKELFSKSLSIVDQLIFLIQTKPHQMKRELQSGVVRLQPCYNLCSEKCKYDDEQMGWNIERKTFEQTVYD